MKTKPKKFRFKRLFQFSIRSTLLAMLAVAIGVNWRFQPQTRKLLGGGSIWDELYPISLAVFSKP